MVDRKMTTITKTIIVCDNCEEEMEEFQELNCYHCDADLCEDCAINCYQCGEYFCEECIEEYDYEFYCSDCVAEVIRVCYHCDEDFNKEIQGVFGIAFDYNEEGQHTEDEWFCDDCASKLEVR